MKFKKVFHFFSTLFIINSMIGVLPAGATSLQSGGSFTRQINSSLVTSFPTSGNAGADVAGLQMPEIANEVRAAEAAGAQTNKPPQNITNHLLVGRSHSRDHRDGDHHHSRGSLTSPNVKSSAIASSNPGLFTSFNGLDLRYQRLATCCIQSIASFSLRQSKP